MSNVDYSQHLREMASGTRARPIRGDVVRDNQYEVTNALRHGPSAIHGTGLFAGRSYFAADLIVMPKRRFLRNVYIRRDGTDPAPNAIGVAPNLWITSAPPLDVLNHSCAPNACIGRRGALIALIAIAIGDEITIDYSTTECDPQWRMDCHCGSPSCRTVLAPIQFTFETLPPAPPAMQRAWRRLRAI